MKSVEMSGRSIIVSERWIFEDYRVGIAADSQINLSAPLRPCGFIV